MKSSHSDNDDSDIDAQMSDFDACSDTSGDEGQTELTHAQKAVNILAGIISDGLTKVPDYFRKDGKYEKLSQIKDYLTKLGKALDLEFAHVFEKEAQELTSDHEKWSGAFESNDLIYLSKGSSLHSLFKSVASVEYTWKKNRLDCAIGSAERDIQFPGDDEVESKLHTL